MSSSVHVDNKGTDIVVLGFSSTQGLDGHSLTAEKMYSINFTVTRKNFCIKKACIPMEQIVIYLLMILKLLNSKQKILKL